MLTLPCNLLPRPSSRPQRRTPLPSKPPQKACLLPAKSKLLLSRTIKLSPYRTGKEPCGKRLSSGLRFHPDALAKRATIQATPPTTAKNHTDIQASECSETLCVMIAARITTAAISHTKTATTQHQ